MTHRRLRDALARRGVMPIDAVGMPFDPYLHEAVAVEPCPEERDGVVLREERRGYRTAEGVFRLAQVVVGCAAPPKAPSRGRRHGRAASGHTAGDPDRSPVANGLREDEGGDGETATAEHQVEDRGENSPAGGS